MLPLPKALARPLTRNVIEMARWFSSQCCSSFRMVGLWQVLVAVEEMASVLHAVGGTGTRAGETRGIVMTEDREDGPHVAQHICQDHHERCPLWAARGECQANPKYMRGCPHLPLPLLFLERKDLSAWAILHRRAREASGAGQAPRSAASAATNETNSASQGIGTSQRHPHPSLAADGFGPDPGAGGGAQGGGVARKLQGVLRGLQPARPHRGR